MNNVTFSIFEFIFKIRLKQINPKTISIFLSVLGYEQSYFINKKKSKYSNLPLKNQLLSNNARTLCYLVAIVLKHNILEQMRPCQGTDKTFKL